MIKIFPDTETLNVFAAERFFEIYESSLAANDHLSVALAGGSTPKALYRRLAGSEFKNKIDWSKVFFFFGDERNVLPDDPESNYRMARENLFETIEAPAANIYRWPTDIRDATEAAYEYASAIRDFFVLSDRGQFPRFDLILLGMGDDGHTASLFPFTPALAETEKIAVANPVPKFDTTRLTLTFPAINQARNIIFLVAGETKAPVLQEILEGRFDPRQFPAQSIRPADGELSWLIDEKAARLLSDSTRL
jgi:6-phosphogluconolactonase